MGKEDVGEDPPSYESSVQPSAPPQSGYPPHQSDFLTSQSGYPPPQSCYTPLYSGYPSPQSGYSYPQTVIQSPQPLGVQGIYQSSCNGCNMENDAFWFPFTAKCRKFQIVYLIFAVITVIFLAATMKPFPEGPFPHAAIIMFLVFTIIVTLMFYIPCTLGSFPHTCDRKN